MKQIRTEKPSKICSTIQRIFPSEKYNNRVKWKEPTADETPEPFSHILEELES